MFYMWPLSPTKEAADAGRNEWPNPVQVMLRSSARIHDVTEKACSSVYRGGGGIWGAATRQNKAVKSSIVGFGLRILGTFLQLRGPEGRIITTRRRITAIGEDFLKIAGFYFPFISPTGAPTIHTVALCGLNSGTSFFASPVVPEVRWSPVPWRSARRSLSTSRASIMEASKVSPSHFTEAVSPWSW